MKSFNQFLFERDLTPQEALSILSISAQDAGDPDKLKRAYRSASMKAHPDRGGDVETMQQVNAAYEKLQNTAVARNSRENMYQQMKKNREEAEAVVKKYFDQFDTEVYMQYLTDVFGTEMTSIEKDQYSDGIAFKEIEFSSDNREIVVDVRLSYNYANYIQRKGSLGSNDDSLVGDVGVMVEIVYKRNKVKVTRGNYNVEKYTDILSNPETILPRKKLERQLKKVDAKNSDGSVEWIKPADFASTLKTNLRYGKLFKGSNGLTYQLKFGRDDEYVLQAGRVTMQRKGLWSVSLFKKGNRASDKFMPSIPETNKGIDVLLSLINEIKNSSSPERVYDKYADEWKPKNKYSELYPE